MILLSCCTRKKGCALAEWSQSRKISRNGAKPRFRKCRNRCKETADALTPAYLRRQTTPRCSFCMIYTFWRAARVVCLLVSVEAASIAGRRPSALFSSNARLRGHPTQRRYRFWPHHSRHSMYLHTLCNFFGSHRSGCCVLRVLERENRPEDERRPLQPVAHFCRLRSAHATPPCALTGVRTLS